jgi:hypothetical protein
MSKRKSELEVEKKNVEQKIKILQNSKYKKTKKIAKRDKKNLKN